MEKASENRSVRSCYGLRRNIVPSKQFEDFCVEGVSLSKKKCLRSRNTGVNGDTSTSQAFLPLPIFSDHSYCIGNAALTLPLKTPGHQPTFRNGDGGHCKPISEPLFPSTQVEFEGTDSGSTQTQPFHLVLTKKQADTVQAEHRGEGELVLQGKSGVSKAPLKETLEIAAILLDLGQHVHLQNTVPQAGSPPQETPVIQERSSEGQQGISSSEVNAQPDTTNGRRKKQAKPCRVVPRKKPDQDFKLLIVPQAALFCSPGLGGGLPGTISQILGIHETSVHSSTKRNDNGQKNDGEKFSPLDIDIPFEWPAMPREKEDMSFPHLPDSSYKAEVAERKRREAALQASLRQLEEPLEERYIKNAAVLPDLRQPASGFIQSQCPSSSSELLPQEEPPKIHGCSVEGYKRLYHSLVDPKLTTKTGHPRPYSLQMGRVIKQRLWEKFSCPSFVETVDADGRVWITESYCSPTLQPHAPLIEVDISEEPMPAKPKRKRARH